MPGKNGKVHLLRIIFCLFVILFHIGRDLPSGQDFATHGYIGVEFFFIVGGILMGRSLESAWRQESSGRDIGTRSGSFLWRKVKAVLPYHLFFYGLMFVVHALNGRHLTLTFFMDKLPGLFFLNYFGLHGSTGTGTVLKLEWYLGSMFLAVAIIYPIALKCGRAFTRWAAPIIGLLILCFMMVTQGKLSGIELWDHVIWHAHLRAIAETLIGLVCHEISVLLARRGTPAGGADSGGSAGSGGFRTWQRVLLFLIEWGCYAGAAAYVFSDLSDIYEMHIFCLLAVGLTISFSGQSILGNSRVFNNRLCYFLGDISLPLYLGQNVARRLLIPRFPEWSTPQLILVIVICDLLIGTACLLVWRAVSQRFRERRAEKEAAA